MKLPIVVAACVIPAAAFAQTGNPPPGVKHRLEVSMSLEREAPAIRENRDRPRADLKLRIQISDHAIDSDYFGVVTFDYSSADPAKEAAAKTVWEDPACHIDRGLPKISIIGIQGSLAAPDKTFAIAALPRRVGKHVPDDEVIAQRVTQNGQRPRAAEEKLGISLRARTKRSGVLANLDLIATRCPL